MKELHLLSSGSPVSDATLAGVKMGLLVSDDIFNLSNCFLRLIPRSCLKRGFFFSGKCGQKQDLSVRRVTGSTSLSMARLSARLAALRSEHQPGV